MDERIRKIRKHARENGVPLYVCPSCGRKTLYPEGEHGALNALSRFNRKVSICSLCGLAEAGMDYFPEYARTCADGQV